MDIALLDTLTSFGIGAVLAGIVILWKREDDKRYAQNLCELTTRMDATINQLLQVVESNTAALIELKAMIETRDERSSYSGASTRR